MKRLTINVSDDTHARLDKRARENGCDVAELLRRDVALGAWVWERRRMPARTGRVLGPWLVVLVLVYLLAGTGMWLWGLVDDQGPGVTVSAYMAALGVVWLLARALRALDRRADLDALDTVAVYLTNSPVGVNRYAPEIRAATGLGPGRIATALETLVAARLVEKGWERPEGDPNGRGRRWFRSVVNAPPGLEERLDGAFGGER